MKIYRAKKEEKNGVWISKIQLRKCNAIRGNKVNKLLKLLKEEFSIENLP